MDKYLAEFRLFGIDTKVHWSFILVLAFGAFLYGIGPAGWIVGGIYGAITFLLLFVCVTLHELGHALTARRFGINTRSILLLPIGGVANLERMPEKPIQELLIVVAGPLVNFAIAALLVPAVFLFGFEAAGNLGNPAVLSENIRQPGIVNLLLYLFMMNVMLAFFNLLPAFPMDGGRVLRAVLAMFLPYTRATNIAAGCGQVMAVLFGIVGFFTNWMLMLVAFFVYFAARGEARHVQMRSLVQGARVRDVMVPRYHVLAPELPLTAAVDALLADHQQDFPVVAEGRVIGTLHRVDLLASLAQGRLDAAIRDVMTRDGHFIDESMPLDQAFGILQQSGTAMLPVLHGHELVGVLTTDNIEEWLLVRAALRQRNTAAASTSAAPPRAEEWLRV
jgi:Zn-dependent protease